MTTELEKLILYSLELNDEITWAMQDLVFKPAEAKPQFASSIDTDGEILIDEPHFTNAYFEATLRLIPVASTDLAVEKVSELVKMLQRCAQVSEGLPLEWTPNGSTRSLTWYAILGEIVDLPIEPTGELAGWFIKSPVVKIKLTCRPFGHKEQRVAYESKSSKAALQEAFVGEIGGHVPAEASILLTDKATQNRRYAEWGQDVVTSAEGNPSLTLEPGTTLTVEGYSGTLGEKTGSMSTKVVKVTLRKTSLVICAATNLTHVGPFRLKLRVQVSGEGAYFRASYRGGEGEWRRLPWESVPVVNGWAEIDLSDAYLEAARAGEQISAIRIEGKLGSESENCTAYVDLLELVPSKRYGVAWEPVAFDNPTTLKATDGFNQTEGNATGKEAEIGGKYAEMTKSDTTDFTVFASAHRLKRTAVSDTGTGFLKGRGIGLPIEMTDCAFRFKFYHTVASEPFEELPVYFGTVMSYKDETHYCAAVLYLYRAKGVKPHSKVWKLRIYGPSGVLFGVELWNQFGGGESLTGEFLAVIQGTTLSVYGSSIIGAPLELWGSATDENIGVKGKTFLYDGNEAATAYTREYDDLALWLPEQPLVCASGQSLLVGSTSVQRKNSAGTVYSDVNYRGADLYLDPAGPTGRVNRLAAKLRRKNTKEEIDEIKDEQAMEVLVRERYLTPR